MPKRWADEKGNWTKPKQSLLANIALYVLKRLCNNLLLGYIIVIYASATPFVSRIRTRWIISVK